jgi:diketogulonate reductase-like aldo/keto reductase
MPEAPVLIENVRLPRFLYGTAWKEDRTQAVVELALEQGFRGIDAANQRRHYHEAAVGQAVQSAIQRGLVSRDELFLQSKFTFRQGQDHRLPYDLNAPIAVQVEQSYTSTLQHLGVQHLDSYLLHGPMQRVGLTEDDWSAWRAMETIAKSGRVRLLGVSNFTADQLRQLISGATILPRFVQNRCYASQGWGREVRDVCRAQGIIYQAFSLLTANRSLLASAWIHDIAKRYGRSVEQVIFRFAIGLGMLPLTGTTDKDHMQADLEVLGFQVQQADLSRIENSLAG